MSDPYTSPAGADIDPSSVSYIGRVTFNAKPDQKLIKLVRRVDTGKLLYKDAAVGEEGTWDFRNPELVMMKKQEIRQLNGGRPGQEAIVISSVSGVMRSEKKVGGAVDGTTIAEQQAIRENIMENYTLAGIVQGSVKTNRDNVSSQVVSITCGGLLSIVNTGPEPIRAGDLLYWDWPKLTADGAADKSSYTTPPYYKSNKIPVVVRRFKYSDITKRIPDEIAAGTDAGNKLVTGLISLASVLGSNLSNANARNILRGVGLTNAQKDELYEFFAGLLAVHNKYKDRVFARATSNAARGVKVDVVFGSYRH